MTWAIGRRSKRSRRRRRARNTVIGAGRHIAVDTAGCLIRTGDRLIATIGVEDLVIVDAGDALLVCHRDRTQDVREVVERLKREGGEAYL